MGFYFFRGSGNPVYYTSIYCYEALLLSKQAFFATGGFFYKFLFLDFQLFAGKTCRVNRNLFNQYLVLQSTYYTFVLLKAK